MGEEEGVEGEDVNVRFGANERYSERAGSEPSLGEPLNSMFAWQD